MKIKANMGDFPTAFPDINAGTGKVDEIRIGTNYQQGPAIFMYYLGRIQGVRNFPKHTLYVFLETQLL